MQTTCIAYLLSKVTELHTLFSTMYRNEKAHTWSPSEIIHAETSTNHIVMILNRPVALDFQPNFILNLWRKAVLRVTVDGGTNCWLSWLKLNNCDQQNNVAPDLITGDMDSLSNDVLDYFIKKNKNVQVIKTPDQNETDFTKALIEVRRYILKENLQIDTVVVLVDSSGRFDQIIGNINTLFKADNILVDVKVVLLGSNSLTWLLKGKTRHIINIPLKLRQTHEWCALMPISNPCRVTSTGLKWNLSNTLLEFGKLVCTSNTSNGESSVTIHSDGPVIWSMGIENLLYRLVIIYSIAIKWWS